MLTRIEINGFKTFEGFTLDLSPFVVILGANASGKSNLFDAIRFLSHLSTSDLRTAVKGLRGEPYELFRKRGDGTSFSKMSFAVEVLLEPTVRDPWGSEVRITHSRMRYELEIEYRKDERGIERLVVAREEAKPISAREDRWLPWGEKVSRQFKKVFIHYARQTPWLSTDKSDGGKPIFKIHSDGHGGRTRSAEWAEATVVSSITSAEFPHLYALREELRAWRFLQLDPMALRRPSPTTATEDLEPDGANLATVLARIQAETRTDAMPKGVISDIITDLSDMIPDVIDLNVEEDKKNRVYRVDVVMRGNPPFSSRVVSDGTLRILALLTLLHDPKHRGLICFEEPENGVHPARLKAMIKRLRELVSDPVSSENSINSPLSQIIMNSHSPVVLSGLQSYEAMFADIVDIIDPETRSISRVTRFRPVLRQPQGNLKNLYAADKEIDFVSSFEVDSYLSTVNQED